MNLVVLVTLTAALTNFFNKGFEDVLDFRLPPQRLVFALSGPSPTGLMEMEGFLE